MKPAPDFLIAIEFYIPILISQLNLLFRLQILCQNYTSTCGKRVTPRQQGLQCEPCNLLLVSAHFLTIQIQ